MNKNYIIGALCLVVVGMLIAYLIRPAPSPQILGTLTTEQETELRANLATLEGQNDSLKAELGKVQQKEIVAQEGFKRAVATLQKENKRLSENPKVVEVRASVPEIDSLLALKDIIILRQADRITEMEHTAQVTKDINDKLVANFEKRLSDTEGLLVDKESEVIALQQDNKKLKQRLTWTKITGVVLLGGIIALSL